jgi:hypothetical protein
LIRVNAWHYEKHTCVKETYHAIMNKHELNFDFDLLAFGLVMNQRSMNANAVIVDELTRTLDTRARQATKTKDDYTLVFLDNLKLTVRRDVTVVSDCSRACLK